MVWAALGCAPLAAQRFTLSGTVVDGASSRPMAGVAITLDTEKWEPVGDPVLTDAQGRFAIGGLAAGEYILLAEGSFGSVRYGAVADPGWVSTVRVGGARGDKSVVFRIVPRGSIEGMIRDEFGEAMQGAPVSIVRNVWRNGHTTTANVGQKMTDDRGRYRFGNLAPGSYAVCVSGQNTAAPVPGPVDFAARSASRGYLRNCDRTFQLAPGQRAQVDLSPRIGSTATVSGHVRNLPAQTGMSIMLVPVEREGQPAQSASWDNSGAFAIRNVEPGRYRLRASAATMQGPVRADVAVDVNGSDVSDLDLTLGAAPTVDVGIHAADAQGFDLTRIFASLRSADSADTPGFERSKDGGIQFQSVAAGRYRLSVTVPEGCLESLKLGEKDVRGAAFDVGADARVRLEASLTKNCGTLTVRAVRDGEAVPGAKVVILTSGTPQDPGDIREDFANDEGELALPDLTPGRYLVWAWTSDSSGPSSLAAVESQATAVEVKGREPVTIDVPLLKSEGSGQ